MVVYANFLSPVRGLIKHEEPGSSQRPVIEDSNEYRKNDIGIFFPNVALQSPNGSS